MLQEKTFACKVKGKKRQLKVSQMNIMLFDESGTMPVESWLFERVDGWEFDKDTKLFMLRHGKAIGQKKKSDENVFTMLSTDDGDELIAAIDGAVAAVVKEKKRVAKEKKKAEREEQMSAPAPEGVPPEPEPNSPKLNIRH